MRQCDKFDGCRQNDMSAIDYLCKLQDIADTIGDVSEDNIVVAFFCCAQVYLCVKLADGGYEVTDLTLEQLEELLWKEEMTSQRMRGRNLVKRNLTMTIPKSLMDTNKPCQKTVQSLQAQAEAQLGQF
jgi:hypothetical protein